jgi:hypothetical protein
VFSDLPLDFLSGVPNLDGVSTAGGSCDSPDAWCFYSVDLGFNFTFSTTDFTYSITPETVAEPEMLSLFTTGLGLLLFRLRRRERAA